MDLSILALFQFITVAILTKLPYLWPVQASLSWFQIMLDNHLVICYDGIFQVHLVYTLL